MTEALSVGRNFSMSAADRARNPVAHNNVDVDGHVLSKLSARSSRADCVRDASFKA
jgi:hypothetical protein